MMFPDPDRADSAQVRHIEIKHGVHERAWEGNVVGVGLSNGFIEPLESTGLMLTHECIMKMVHTLGMRQGHVTQYDIDLFNFGFNEQIWGFKDFISQHYGLTRRNDTLYWKHVSSNIHYSKAMRDFKTTLLTSSHDLAHRIHRSNTFTPNMSGILYIAAGMGYNPVSKHKVEYLNTIYREDPDQYKFVRESWEEHKKSTMRAISKLQTHYEFLRDHIYHNS
jgi:tryptophan halogenase